jgi:uncharacterized protein (DUF1800 family)
MKHHSLFSFFSMAAALGILACVLPTPVQAEVLTVYPSNSSLEVGSTLQFTAYVPLTNNAIQWLVNDVVGGSATTGTISATGLYTPPATIPAANVMTIKARSVATPTAIGTTSLTITRKNPSLWSTSPSSVSVGTFQISLNGANFANDSQVLINGSPVSTTYVSPTALIATSTATAVGTLQVSVRQPGNGTITGNSVALKVTAVPVVVKVSPSAATVQLGGSQAFTSSVTGSTNTAVTWSVSSGAGTIDSTTGVYTAPATLPASTAVTILATSQASPSSTASASITIAPPPIVVSVSPATVSVQAGKTQAFTATVTGTTNTAVTWTITSGLGSIGASTGIYTAPSSIPAASTVSIRATAVASASSTASATISLTVPPPPPPSVVSLSAARFLEQTSFGPTPATLAEVGKKGINQFLQDQFAMPETVIPTPSGNSMSALTSWALSNYTSAPDQLRQRVAYSLSQILVTSSNKLIYPDAVLPWMRLLSSQSFGNYRTLLRSLTVCPSMGKYLDLAGSAKASVSGAPNENYARELMQLFTIGLWQLNLDGSQKLDATGQPIPTYNQATVVEVAKALTGWVYANNAYEDFTTNMVPSPARHETTSKSILGVTVPAGQTVDQDLDSVITILMNHPNMAPFIATRLIRSLVTSNPSPGYIQRVATVFNDNGQGVKGDLKAVITAIIMDAEARNDTPTATSGRLKEPILGVSAFLRALNGGFAPNNGLTYLYDYISQSVLSPPSVFSWFSPLYRLPTDRTLFGPEFQIYSPSDCTLRANMIFQMLNNPGTDVVIDLSPFQPYGNDMPGLVEMANQTFLYGRMPAGMKQAIITAATPGYDAKTRIETVIYLTILSGQFNVQF